MSLVTAPTFAIKEISWFLDQPAQVNRGTYSGARQVVSNPWHGKWRASVTLKTEQGEANFRTMRGFLTSLLGQVNTFLLPATEGNQGLSDTTASAGASQGATTISLASSPAIKAGMMGTVVLPSGNQQLVMFTADASGATNTFRPALREAVSIGATVKLASPVCHVALSNSEYGWNVATWRLYGIQFDVEEAF
jgi:hypothetical protein